MGPRMTVPFHLSRDTPVVSRTSTWRHADGDPACNTATPCQTSCAPSSTIGAPFAPSRCSGPYAINADPRLTVWEMVHQLVRALDKGGESAAAALVARIGSRAETVRELAYRLYTVCERRKRAQEALAYNALVQSWPEIARLAAEQRGATPVQERLI